MHSCNVGGRVSLASRVRACEATARRALDVARQLVVLRRRMVDFALILVGFVTVSVAATAGTSGPVRAWYYDSYGNAIEDCASVPYGAPCGWMPGGGGYGAPMPSDLGRCKRVAVGGGHFAAITTSDQLRMWGNNNRGQTDVPWYLGPASRVALGDEHTVAIDVDGYAVGWGNNDYGQFNLPYNLGLCKEVAAGSRHSLFINTNGSVRAFGDNGHGQCNVPADLGTCTAIAAGELHSVALRSDGVVRAWGGSPAWCPGCGDCGQTSANGYGGITAISATYRSTSVLQGSNNSITWGCVNCASSLPWDSVGYRSITGTYSHLVGVTNDGRLRGRGLAANPWGWSECQEFGDSRFPSGIGRVVTVAGSTLWGGSYSLFIAIQDDDCNNNGIADADDIASGAVLDLNTNNRPDVCEIADGSEKDCNLDGRIDSYQVQHGEVLDYNGNGIPDSCDVATGIEEDCDHNGVIDSVQQQLNVVFNVQSGQVGPIGYSSPRSVDLAAPPYTLGDVTLQVTAFGDFSSVAEYVKIYLNGRWVSEAFSDAGWPGMPSYKNDCQYPIGRYITIPRDFFNEAIEAGFTTSAVFEIVPSIAVNANQCPSGSWVQISLAYTASITGDCNANGLLDTCEVAQFPEFDANGNGVIDACENYSLVFQCEGDLDGDGSVNTADISLMLMSFGRAMPGDPNDLDGSGFVDTADISLMLLNYGDC